ncbi:PDGLE domain-containing protein [Anthocerotibacter panamensis]|uniref:PDGLE domain-containing protein n=1 Tax=Anthocerotibacter panamensis TaxID=2857077 RepID=UPI001C408460|nr:PDGLE domain-containing protein [Anthocerotibacter panamensis]
MTRPKRNWLLGGLVVALLVAALVSPWASQNPDGLNKVAQDQGFSAQATQTPAEHLPFFQIFESYALRGIENRAVAKALAGAAGTLLVFGLAWGVGAMMRRSRGVDS